MAKNKKWNETPLRYGVIHTRLSSWRYFHEYIDQTLLDYPGYIFRGQRSEHWKLESTLDRLTKRLPEEEREGVKGLILAKFKYAARGRRGANPSKLSRDETWALGQHHGLATPLLDWTSSPYVAAFFALVEDREDGDGDATVWAVHHHSVTEKSKGIKKDEVNTNDLDSKIIRMINPLTDENARLVNQSGIFLYLPENIELEEWIKSNFKYRENGYVLLKISIPATDRELALVFLNRMNINYLTLFPDLYGASKHSNLATEISRY